MSAPITKNVQSPYTPFIIYCENCIAECRHCLASTTTRDACHKELNDAVTALTRAVEIMRSNSPFAPRYLVDCAEVCALCSERCECFDNLACRSAAKACREAVLVCRRGSLI